MRAIGCTNADTYSYGHGSCNSYSYRYSYSYSHSYGNPFAESYSVAKAASDPMASLDAVNKEATRMHLAGS